MVVAENEGTEDATTVAVPLEQWNLIGSALKAAHTAVEAVAPPYEAYILDVEGALQKMIAATSEGSSKDRLLRAVLTPDELVPTVAEAAVLHYGATISNTVDKEYLMGWRKHSADAIARRDRLRTMHVAKIVSLHCRMKNEFSTPPIIIMETIERAFQGTTYYDWQRQCRGRSVMGPTWLVEAMKGLDNWVPPSRLVQRCEKRFSIQYSFSVRDNLEFWLRKKWSGRVKDGEKVDTEVLHTTTGLNMPIPTSIMIEDTPEMEDWPYMNSWDMQLCVLSDMELENYLRPMWRKVLALHADVEEDHLALFRRPPSSADNQPDRPPTYCYSVPIIMECGTSSYEDIRKIIDAVRRDNPMADKHVVVGDMQTFFRIWWEKAKNRDKYNDIVGMAGEWHQGAHLLCAVVQINSVFTYEPIVHFLGIKGLNKQCIMKEHEVRYRWTLIILTAGLKWLKTIFSEVELADPKLLLRRVEKNTPVSNFIGFLYFHATVVLCHKQALQTDDPATLNFLWKYSLMLYGPTGKYIYKKGCLMQAKVLFDSEANVSNLFELHRTYTRGGPCRGNAWDHLNENVSCPFSPSMCYVP